ncbi:MAG: four helix bundle protein [bacterium]|nr:four helix bundle protein [Candidatus Limimorpha caballi]
MIMVKKFENLVIFDKARNLCKKIYEITNETPFKYDVRFVQQIHASAGSIMDNIAEGYERDGNKEFIYFLYISKGSCGELRSQILRAYDVGFINSETHEKITTECLQLSASISNLIKSIKDSEIKGTKYKNS